MAELPIWFVILTSAVTIIAGIPYVIKLISYLVITPKIDLNGGKSSDGITVHNKGEGTLNVEIDYLHPRVGEMDSIQSELQVQTIGPIRLEPDTFYEVTPEGPILKSPIAYVTVKPKIRLNEICRFFPPFWGSVELQHKTESFAIYHPNLSLGEFESE